MSWRTVLALASAGACIAGSALAGQPTGTAHVEAVNARAGTLVLLGETYRLTDSTHFVDAHGRRAELADLRAIPPGAKLVSSKDVDAVRWKASETRNGWVLDELEIVGGLPD